MKRLFVIVAFMMVFLAGCSFNNFETSNLMHPPKATGEMSQIQSLIEKTVGSDITFKYPQNGDYKSAIIMHDIDNDNEDEAVAIYQLNPQDTLIYIMIIDKVDGEWKEVKTITSQNTDLDKVCFGDINGNGNDDIILGWSSYTNYAKEITVILSQDDDYEVLNPGETYSDMLANDFNSDGKAELLLLSLSRREETSTDSDIDRAAKARLIKFNNENNLFEIIDTVLMDSTVVRYNNVKFGKIDERRKGAFIDGMTGKEKVTTEIVYWNEEEKSLIAPLYNSQTFSADAFLRDSVIQSNDLNGDGIIEIPKVALKQDNLNANNVYVLSWFRYNTNTRIPEFVESVIMNDSDSYIFVVPDKWKGATEGTFKIKLDYDYDTRTMMVYEQTEQAGQFVKGKEIFNILVLSRKEYNDLTDKDKYTVLAQENNKIYAAITLDESTELTLSQDEIINGFKVI